MIITLTESYRTEIISQKYTKHEKEHYDGGQMNVRIAYMYDIGMVKNSTFYLALLKGMHIFLQSWEHAVFENTYFTFI